MTIVPSPVAAQPTAEVLPITQVILNTFTKDPMFMINALIAGLFIGYYLIFGSPMDESKSPNRGKKGDPNVVLIGPSDSGKTTIFTKLVYNEPPQTHTSLKPSTSTLNLSSRSIKISDLPGHPRLKESVQHLATEATAAIFVCDVSSLIRNGSHVAEELPAVLTRLAASSLTSPSAPIPRLLILANKSDLLRSGTPSGSSEIDEKTKQTAIERTKLILTREMDRLKSARQASSGRIEGIGAVPLTSTTASFFGLGRFFRRSASKSSSGVLSEEGLAEAQAMIWGQNGKFSWDEVEGIDVQWLASGNVNTPGSGEKGKGDDGLGDVREWLSRL